MIPFTCPAKKIDQVDSENKDMGWFYMIQEKVIKIHQLWRVEVAKYKCNQITLPVLFESF